MLVENKLFATLDPTTRRVALSGGHEILMTDTVGFVRKLPHNLVEAFKSTLEEAVLADFIILILDASDPYMEDHRKTTLSVLEELGAKDKEIITIFNKIDIVDDPVLMARLNAGNPGALFLSAKSGKGLDELRGGLEKKISKSGEICKLNIPPERHDLISKLHQTGKVLSLDYLDDGTADMTALIPEKERKVFRKYSGES